MTDIETLKQHACDNYEAGGHWISETYSDAEYAEVLAQCGSVNAAKARLKDLWELFNDRQKDCSW